jgi:hypothetical protein
MVDIFIGIEFAVAVHIFAIVGDLCPFRVNRKLARRAGVSVSSEFAHNRIPPQRPR